MERDETERGKARSTDPQTSHDAAASVDVQDLELEVLRNLQKFYLTGMTCSEIAHFAEMPRDSISPRMKNLVAKGMVMDSGESRVPMTSKTRRKQIVWQITKKGAGIASAKKTDVQQSEPS